MSAWLDAAVGRLPAPWAAAMARACWQGGLALALAWVACRLMTGMPGRIRCWVWRAAYAKLLAALFWATPLALPLMSAEPAGQRDGSAHNFIGASVLEGDALSPAAVVENRRAQPPAPVAAATPAFAREPPLRRPLWVLAIFMVWAAGGVVALVRILCAARATAVLRRRCRLIDDIVVQRMAADLARCFGMRRPPPVLAVADGIASPLLLGAWRPMILIPADLLESCRPAELRLMLAHELAHLKRRDLRWNALPAAAHCLFWFHPMLWLARREWRLAQEVACDDAATAVTRSRPADYARALLCVVERYVVPSPRLLAVGVFQSGRTLERRLLAMRHFNSWSRRHMRFVAVIVLGVSAVGIPSWRIIARAGPADAAGRRIENGAAGAPSERTEATAGPERSARTQPAAAGDVGGTPLDPDFVKAIGAIVAKSADIRPLTGGRVTAVNHKEGDRVKAGDLLVQLDDQRERIQVEAARVDLKKKMVDLRRSETVYKADISRGNFTNAEIEEARIQIEIGEVAVRYHEAQLQQFRITAPFDGVISALNAQLGEVIAGNGIGRVVAVDDLRVEMNVPDAAAARIKPGMPVEVAVLADPDRKLTGRIEFVSPEVDSRAQVVRVKATLDSAGTAVRPGMQAMVRIDLRQASSERK